ncbi:MAG: hypothetical protein HFJ66_06420 [Eggerthellaceae bacterium]|nr:hypothetical protein [Eggerthellaceae bacterium]
MAKDKKRSIGHIVGLAAGSVLGLAAAVVAGFNIYIHATYADFYKEMRQEFPIPDINHGFVPQDMAWLGGSQQWLFSGYVGDHGPSPVYRTAESGTDVVKFFVKNPDGSVYDGHGGGITADDQFTFLTTEDGYLVLNTQEVATAEPGSQVQAIAKVDLGIDPAFINIDKGTLYTGVFYYATDYPTPPEQHLTAPDGTQNHAVMYAFDADADGEFGYTNVPSRVYSIPDRTQGVCINQEGQMLFSCSWGFQASSLPAYSLEGLEPEGTYTAMGAEVPLYFMSATNKVSEFTAPPMSEGLVEKDGWVYYASESACNKYIFGKLYASGFVVALPL